MSQASQDLTINSGLTVGAVNQAWNVASGHTLTVAGAFTRTAGATLAIGGNTGTVGFNPTLANGIIGPWATVNSSGTAANNAAGGFTYATVSNGNIVPYTLASNVTTFGWTTSNGNATNYDVAGIAGFLGFARTANTVRYTGVAGTQYWGTNSTTAVTLNGLMNSGTGTLTFAQLGGASLGQVKVGANNELVLNAASAPIVIAIPILDGGASSSLTITSAGTNSVVLSSTNNYTGNTIVNGNLQLGVANAIPGGLGKGNAIVNGMVDLNGFSEGINGLSGAGAIDNTSATSATLTTGSNNATGAFSGVIKNSGGAMSLIKTGTGALTLGGNNTFSGGVTVQNAAGTLNIGSPTALGSGTLNMNMAGATLNNTSGGALVVANPLTIGASFTFAGSSDLTFGGAVSLGSLAKTITTTAGTLTLSGAVSGSGAFTKNGAGTLVFSGLNPFTGTTVVSGGALLINGSASTGTITVGSTGKLGGSGVIGGAVTVQSGGTLAPGAGIGTLTLAVPPALGGVTVMEINRASSQTADQLILTSGDLTYGGTLTVTNMGPVLQAGDSFQLFSSSAGSLAGAFAVTNLPSLNPDLGWNFNSASGLLTVIQTAATNPTNISFTIENGSISLSWPSDHTGWRLQVQTNNLTTGLGANWFDVAGSSQTNSVSIPVDQAQGSVFYRLIYP
jgi:autotransporter-associated beta strand protein